MPFRRDGEGLHRSVDPADGRPYVYGMNFMDAAPSVFACFDQPDLKAPYTMHVTAPSDWVVIGNAPAVEPSSAGGGTSRWDFAPTPPLSTYFVTLVAGPYHVVRDEHDGIPLGLSARLSLATALDKDADEILTVTKQSFDELHRLFGIRYPFGDYHQAFVPEFNAGAMENPGCVTFRDPLVFSSRVTRARHIARATTIAHEMAHQWFGDIVTPAWWDDLWLNESFAEYLGNRVVADATEFEETWTDMVYSRRQWGLVADQGPSTHPVAGNGAVDASAALQDFDGISYAKGSGILKQLNAKMGDQVFFDGVIDHLTRHRFANATMLDLFESWSAPGRASSTTSHQLAADPGPGHAGARPGGGGRASYAAGGPPGRPAAHIRVAVGRRRLVERPRPGARPPETPFGRPARGQRGHPRRVRRELGRLGRGPDHGPGAGRPAARASTTTCSGPASGTTCAAATTTASSTRPTCSTSPSRACRWRTPRTPNAARCTGCSGRSCRWPGRTRPPGCTRRRSRRSRRPSPARGGSSRRSAPSCPRPPTSTRSTCGRAAATCPTGIALDVDLRWRVLVRLATLGAVDLDRLDAELAVEPTGDARVSHAKAHASLPDAGGQGLGVVLLHRARPTSPTTSSPPPASACGAAARSPSPSRTSTATSPTSPRRSRCAAAGCSRTRPSTSSRGPRSRSETLEKAQAVVADGSVDLSLRRRVADEAATLRAPPRHPAHLPP